MVSRIMTIGTVKFDHSANFKFPSSSLNLKKIKVVETKLERYSSPNYISILCQKHITTPPICENLARLQNGVKNLETSSSIIMEKSLKKVP